MAITRGATITPYQRSGNDTDASVAHTVDSGTTLLIYTVHYEAAETVDVVPQWSLGGGETFTLIDETTRSGSAADVCTSTFALLNPTAGSGTISCTVSANDNLICVAINYLGTVTSSLAAAIQFIAEDVDNGGSTTPNTTVFSSAGTTGNTLLAVGTLKGGDGTGVTVPTNFSEIFDDNSGGTSATADVGGYVCDYIGGAPSACSWTWGTTNENASHYFQIVPAASGVEVNVGTASLTLTTNPATVTYDVGVSVGTASLTLATNPATITLDVGVNVGTSGLTLATQPATISYDVGVSVGTASLSLTTLPATVTYDVDVAVGTASLTLATHAATVDIASDVSVNVGTAALTLATLPATVTYDVGVAVNTAGLTLTTLPATVSLDVGVDVGTASLTLATQPAAITYDVNVAVGTAALTVTTYAATVDTTSDVSVDVGTVSLSLTTYAATIEATDASTDVEQNSGGWAAQNWYDAYRQRKYNRDKKRRKIREEIKELDGVDAEIAVLLHKDLDREQRDIEIAELERFVKATYDKAQLDQARLYNERVARAYARAAEKATFSALEAFEREMEQAREEDEFLMLAMMVLH